MKIVFRRKLLIIVMALMAVISGFVAYTLAKGNLDLDDFLGNELLIFSEKSRIVQHIFFQGLIQLILLGIVMFLLIRWNSIKNAVLFLVIVMALDVTLATRWNGPYTVYSHWFRSKEVKAHADGFPEGFPVPGDEALIGNTDSRGLVFQTLWRNLNIFHKQVSFEGYNPLHLKGFEDLADNHPRLFETILQNPLVYLSGHVSPLDSLSIHESTGDYDPGRVYFSSGEAEALKGVGGMISGRDTVFIRQFSPVEVVIGTFNEGPVLLSLLQNNYPGWKATVDGQPARVYTGNMSFLAVEVPAGQREVVFLYGAGKVRIGFWVTVIGLGVLVLIWRLALTRL